MVDFVRKWQMQMYKKVGSVQTKCFLFFHYSFRLDLLYDVRHFVFVMFVVKSMTIGKNAHNHSFYSF
jgi:hypothetical protein